MGLRQGLHLLPTPWESSSSVSLLNSWFSVPTVATDNVTKVDPVCGCKSPFAVTVMGDGDVPAFKSLFGGMQDSCANPIWPYAMKQDDFSII